MAEGCWVRNKNDFRTAYRLIIPYFAFEPNRTTLTLEAMREGLKNFTQNSEKYINARKVLGSMLTTAMKAKYTEPNY